MGLADVKENRTVSVCNIRTPSIFDPVKHVCDKIKIISAAYHPECLVSAKNLEVFQFSFS